MYLTENSVHTNKDATGGIRVSQTQALFIMLFNLDTLLDVSIWLHQAVKGMRDKDGSPLPNAHLHVLFSRVCKLLYYRIKPVFVFDGGVPTLKKQTMAARRERKEFAEVESDKASKKLLDNLMKSHAIKEVLGENQPGTSSPGKSSVTTKNKADLFMLPPLPENFQSVEEDDIQNPWTMKDSHRQFIQEKYQDVSDIDIDSEEFHGLPAEIQHEILTELKERGKRLSRLNYVMPEDSKDFSSFQVSKLLKQSGLTNRLDKVVKVMNSGSSKDLTVGLEEDLSSADVHTQRVMSDESSHIILIKGLSTKKRQEELAKLEEESIKSRNDCIVVGESVESDDKERLSENNVDRLMIDSDADEEIDAEIKRTSSRNKNEVVKIESSESSDSSESVPRIQSKKRKHVIDVDLTVADNNAITGVDSCVIDITSEKRESRGANASREKVKVGSEQNKASSDIIDIDDRSSSPVLIINENSDDSNRNVMADSKASPRSDIRSGRDSPPAKLKKYDRENILGTEMEKSAMSGEVITIDEGTDMKDITGANTVSRDTEKSNNSEDEGFVEVTIDTTNIKEDELFPAEMFSMKNEDTKKTEVKDLKDASLSVTVNTPPADTILPTNSTPQDETLPSEDNVSMSDNFTEKNSLVNQYKAITEELEDYHEQLETETRSLQEERGKQERLATSITDQMYTEAQELLRLFGIPYVISPMEAEAQCAQLDDLDLTEGTITDDSDIWLFGGRRVYKNFFNQGQHVELYTQSGIDSQLGLNREIFINLALLCGSDYTEGIRGVGPVTALEILSEFPGTDIESLVAFKSWWLDINKRKKHPPISKLKTKLKSLDIGEGFPSPAVVEAYLHPTVDPSDDPFFWAIPDLDLLREFTNSKLGWSKVKTDEQLLPVIKKLRERQSQMKINNYFQPENFIEPKKVTSVRVQRALRKIGDPSSADSVKVSTDNSYTSVSVSKVGKALSSIRGKRPVKKGAASRGRRSKNVMLIQEEVNLSESSSCDEDDKLLANLDYESWIIEDRNSKSKSNTKDQKGGKVGKGKGGKGGKGKNKSSVGVKSKKPHRKVLSSDSD
ncbi:hypothetical protein FSP39_017483 [Pinctada imbricata]|uniref:Uncharacterized protein n=1 Tax=Pinctada imbricata TaxID=66713 RepID=A0AA88YFI1_PINIB|nr:hypothetical protein FSP39_017483 [Pinctada imbricata]